MPAPLPPLNDRKFRRYLRLWLLWFALALTALSTAHAQRAPVPLLSDYSQDIWNTRDGLPHNTVLDIAQTQEGYLWLASWEGLARFNGNTFKTFSRSTQPALRDNGIVTLANASNGNLWFSDTHGNLGRWSPGDHMRQWGKLEGLPGNEIDGIVEDPQGSVWLLFNGLGVGHFNPVTGKLQLLLPEHQSTDFIGIRPVLDHDGTLWVGSLQGLLAARNGKLQPVASTQGPLTGTTWPYRAPNGQIFVANGHTLYAIREGKLAPIRALPDAIRITSMLQDHYGVLWLGTESRGIFRVTERGVETVTRTMGLPEGRITTLFEDREHSIWVGTNGGLYRLREALFSTLGLQSGLGNDFVRTLAEDDTHALWLGGSGGLDRRAPDGSIEHVALQSGAVEVQQVDMSVLSLLAAGRSMWVGTYGDGLYRLEDGRVTQHYGHADGLQSAHVRALAAAANGGIWVGTRLGVLHLQNGKLQPLHAPNLPSTLIHALLDTGDALWIASQSGLYRYANGKAEKIELGDGSESIRPLALFYYPRTRAVWVSTDRGLWRVLRDTIQNVGLAQGLPIDTVFQMTVDKQGNAWLGSNRGVMRFHYQQLREVADGRAPRINVDTFDNRNGMASAQVNGGAGISALMTHDGSVWFATAEGAARVQPERVAGFHQLSAPNTVIEGIAIDGKSALLPETNRIDIPAGSRRLTLSWSGLSFVSPQTLQYRTLLEGFDAGWVARGNVRSAEFTSLPPGDYTFRVETATSNYSKPGPQATLLIRVLPYWWQQTWVQIMAGCTLLLLAILAYRARVYVFKRNARRLERLVEERTLGLQQQTEALQAANAEKTALAARLQQQAEYFEQQAYQDALTQLPNRRAFSAIITREFARAQRYQHALCLATLDIDHFKRINDSWSHAAGDLVLQQVASLIRHGLREADFAARIGGEEFTLLFSDTSLKEALAICERLRNLFHAESDWADIAGLQVTFSAGLVQLQPDDADPEQLLKRADGLLYQAKRSGRDRICTDDRDA